MFAVAIIQLGELTLPRETSAEVELDEVSILQIEEVEVHSEKPISSVVSTEEKVREYFSDIPILVDVARCESRYRQFDVNGQPLRGVQNSADVGVMQINEKYHLSAANALGINIYTLEGNMAYARHLYEKSGSAPWVHSSGCWGTTREVALR